MSIPKIQPLAPKLRPDAFDDPDYRCVAYILGGRCRLVSRNEGRSMFYDLQFRRTQPFFYAFDLLYRDGADLRQLGTSQRKHFLKQLAPDGDESQILLADHVEGTGKTFFDLVCSRDLEGIVAKKKSAPNGSSTTWWKIKNPDYTQVERRGELLNRN